MVTSASVPALPALGARLYAARNGRRLADLTARKAARRGELQHLTEHVDRAAFPLLGSEVEVRELPPGLLVRTPQGDVFQRPPTAAFLLRPGVHCESEP